MADDGGVVALEQQLREEWQCLRTLTSEEFAARDLFPRLFHPATCWSQLLRCPFSTTSVPHEVPGRFVVVGSTDVLLHACRLSVVTDDLVLLYLRQPAYPSRTTRVEVMRAVSLHVHLRDFEALLSRDLTPLLLRLATLEADLVGEAAEQGAGPIAEATAIFDMIEAILLRVVQSRHFHLAAYAPNIVSTLAALRGGQMPRFVARLLETAGTAIVVQLERDRIAHEDGELALDAWMATRHLLRHHTVALYRAWPRFALRAFETHRETMQPEVERSLRRVGAFGTRYQGRLRSTRRYECPILHDETMDAVRASDGFVYDRDMLLTHLANGATTSPMTREPVSTIVYPAV